MSQQTGINHATSSVEDEHFAGNLLKGYYEDYNANTRFNYDAILQAATSITLENIAWDQFFQDFQIDPLVLTYEEIVQDIDMDYLGKLAQLIDLDVPLKCKPRSMVKIGNNRNLEFEKEFMRIAAARNFN
jgi:LPS sulfotransferase NodH